ncbi:hypothetical protein D2N39_19380 [Gemmobacter lutimaris]|uniref:Uncharacterized protein n=1 Tax=Gemmobacter lutimaris TaxID=2306023 RepID=A0A398BQL1_9RHOB|nr:hypothetical protein D2N39_19380 [Gemmobacter lutimaris]
MERGAWRGKNGRADMIMIARIVVAAWHVMGMAVLGMIGAVIGLGHHCAGAMLYGLDGGRCGKG